MKEQQKSSGKKSHILTGAMEYAMLHPVLANLILFTVILVGLVSATQLNVQTMPDFPWPVISVRVDWPGASAAEVQDNITLPLADELRSTSDLRTIESFALNGYGYVLLDFKTKTDLSVAFNEVRNMVEQIDLPSSSHRPIISEQQPQDPLLKLVIYGDNINTLRQIANESKQALLSEYNLDKVSVVGLMDEHITLDIDRIDVHRLNRPLDEISKQLIDVSQDRPIGRYETERMNSAVKMPSKPKDAYEIEKKRIHMGGQSYEIDQIVKTSSQKDMFAPYLLYNGKPAILLEVNRAMKGDNALKLVKRFYQWYEKAQFEWPSAIKSKVLLTEYQITEERIALLLENGLVGFVAILLLLWVFVDWSLAMWIVVCIPVAILGSMVLLSYWKVSINFLSSFGFLMALGMIVDDTIVVAETAYGSIQRGAKTLTAVLVSIKQMFPPLLASALTTVAAFLPILLMQSRYAIFLQDIPKVIIAALAASLLVCFFILPHHLVKTLKNVQAKRKHGSTRDIIENKIHRLQFYQLKVILERIASHAVVTLSVVIGLLLIPFVLLWTNHVPYHFIPYVERDHITMDVDFYPGVSQKTMQQYMAKAKKALKKAEQVLSRGIQDPVVVAVLEKYMLPANPMETAPVFQDELHNHASMIVQLSNPSKRTLSNEKIKKQWRLELDPSVAVEKVNIKQPHGETQWQDINLVIQGYDWQALMRASAEAKRRLRQYDGVKNITDNIKWDGVIYELMVKPEATMLGLKREILAKQIGDFLQGAEVLQSSLPGNNQRVVKLRLNRQEVVGEEMLESFPIYVNGKQLMLGQVADWKMRQRPSVYYQYNGKLAVRVGADVSPGYSAAKIRKHFQKNDIESIENGFNVAVLESMQSPDEKDTLAEIGYGIVVGLVCIYFILAWVSRSYILPLGMMCVIPIGLSGAIWGHFITQTDFSLLSMIAVFGLSGVLINASIILLHQINILKSEQSRLTQVGLLIKAICYRARALLLTTLTTAVCLFPLLMERSIQARWLHPFVVSIIFGLCFSMLTMVLLLPALSGLWQRKRS